MIFACNNLVSRIRSPRHPFVKINQLVVDTPFCQDQASWSQTLLFVKIKLVGCRHPLLSKMKAIDRKCSFLSRSSQLVTNAPFCQDQASWSQTPFCQDQASWSQMILFVKIKSVDHKRPFVKTKPVGRRCSFLSRSSQLIADTLLSRQSQLVADTPYVKIKPVGHKHPLLSKIKPFGRIRPFSSRSK